MKNLCKLSLSFMKAKMMRWIPLVVAIYYPLAAQAAVPFTVIQPSVQSMVVGSSQNLYYDLSTSSSKTVFVNCAVTLDDPINMSYNFNEAGCLAAGGVAINSSIAPASAPINNLLTITVNSGAPVKTYTGKIVFKQVGGQPGAQVTFPFSLTSVTNSTRTITFANYCLAEDAPGGVVIGITTSQPPAAAGATTSTSTVSCSTNADCSSWGYSNCLSSGVCGYGACYQDSDCINPHTGTCQTLIKSTGHNCTYCASDSDCIAGAQCNTSTHLCFWTAPTPTNNTTTPTPDTSFRLGVYNPNTSLTPYTATITVPDDTATNGSTQVWSGGFAGRTNCTYVSGSPGYYNCATADCNSNGSTAGPVNGACILGQGFATPFTQPEITLLAYSPDTYDTSMINGINIPVAIYPNNAPAPSVYNNPYICGSPGGTSDIVTSLATIGGCSWDFTLPSGATNLAYQWIQAAGSACSSNSTCTTAGQVCGVTRSQVTTGTGDATTSCGQLLGYFTLDEICVLNASYNTSLVNCASTTLYGGNTISQLAQCTNLAGNSCYGVGGASTTCGGCTNWNTQSWNGSYLKVPAPSTGLVPNCQYPNTNWVSGDQSTFFGILPTLTWLKAGCPAAYVYAYDDVTSTFTCPGNSGQSGVNYTVEYCPNRKPEIA